MKQIYHTFQQRQISLAKLACDIIILLSILFVIIYLFKIDFLSISYDTINRKSLLYSFILLFTGFLIGIFTWQKLLKVSGYNLKLSQCIYSVGMPIFAKYIPGKIWAVLGRSTLITQFNVPLQHASLISLHSQILLIWSGLILGVIGLVASGNNKLANVNIYLAVVVLSIFVLLPKFQEILFKIIGKLLKSHITPFNLGTLVLVKVLPLFFVQWLAWSFGFYFLSQSLLKQEISIFSTAFVFPLATSIGILSVISPGGIGVREGVMVGALSLLGFKLSSATTISFIARIWFLVGEIFMFFIGLSVKYLSKEVNI